jgi:hypothetical protein
MHRLEIARCGHSTPLAPREPTGAREVIGVREATVVREVIAVRVRAEAPATA